MSKKYALKGINDDHSVCEVCGKDHLKRVMWLVELDQDGGVLSDAFPVGTSCGAKMLGWSHSKVQTKAKNFDSEVFSKRQSLANSHPSMKEHDRLINEVNKLGLFGKARFEHPLFKSAMKASNEAHEWAKTQEILIPLA